MNIAIKTNLSSLGAAARRNLLRHRGRYLALIAGVALYALAGFWWLPRLATQWARDYVRTELHHSLELGRVAFNPFTLTVRVDDARLATADGALLLSFEELLLNFEVSSLWHRAYTFKQVRMTAPDLRALIGADGRLNLAQLRSAQTSASSPGDDAIPAVRIGSLELRRGALHFEDHSRPQPFSTQLAPMEFTLKNFRTERGYDNAYRFSATSSGGERLDWWGTFTVQPLGSSGGFSIARLQASTIAEYLADSLPFAWQAGTIDLHGTYRLSLDGAAEVSLSLPDIAIAATRVGPKGAADAWLSAARIELKNTTASLNQRSVSVQSLRVRGMTADVQRRMDGSINVLELLGPDTPQDNAPWSIRVAEMALEDANLRVEDRTTTPAATTTLAPLAFQVRNYSNAPDALIEVQSTSNINGAGTVNAQGEIRLAPLNAQLQIELANIELAPFQPYLAQSTDLILQTGRLTTSGAFTYRAAADARTDMTYRGDVEVTELATQDRAQRQDFVKWQALRLRKLDYRHSPAQLSIDEIQVRRPYSRFIIHADRSTNVQQVLRLTSAGNGADTQADSDVQPNATARLRTRIRKVTVEDGSAQFADYSVEPSFATGIMKLNGTVSGLSSANNTRARVQLAGSVDHYAPVTISGEANFLAADTYSDLAMDFRNMELTTFNPYSGKFAGYNIAKGKLSTELRYRIRDRQLDAQHHIVVDQLEFGPATGSKDAVPLPIKFAVALLKDRNGVIDLNLPVGGSLDDPSFKIGPIVWKAFVNLLTKVATAPFTALGALFGGGEELAYVDFAPGSATLDDEQAAKLTKLATALVERPQLRIDVPLSVLTPADIDALKQTEYQRALAAALPQNRPASAAERLKALTSLYERHAGSPPTLPAELGADARIAWLEAQLPAHFAVDEPARNALARSRADAVQGALLAKRELSADRVFLTTRASALESPSGTSRMELKLE